MAEWKSGDTGSDIAARNNSLCTSKGGRGWLEGHQQNAGD